MDFPDNLPDLNHQGVSVHDLKNLTSKLAILNIKPCGQGEYLDNVNTHYKLFGSSNLHKKPESWASVFIHKEKIQILTNLITVKF